MIFTFAEFGGCFALEMSAETLADGALLVRFGLNHTSEIRTAHAVAGEGGTIRASLVIGKRKQPTSYVEAKSAR